MCIRDRYYAQQVGARGVPFFVFNNKYAISGAQPVDVFKEVLDKLWTEENPLIKGDESGAVCAPDGTCE